MTSHEITSLTDDQLRSTLVEYNVTVGPITDSTRKLYERKLARLRKELPPIKLFTEEEEEEEEQYEEEEQVELHTKSDTIPFESSTEFSPYSTQYTPNYTSSCYVSSNPFSSNLSRRPLNSRLEQDKSSYTSLRKPGETSAAPAKSSMSWFSKLLILIVLVLLFWMVFMNFEYQPTIPSLTSTN